MDISDSRICKTCEFVLKDKEQDRCPACGSTAITSLADYQAPLSTVKELPDWIERMDKETKETLISLFDYAVPKKIKKTKESDDEPTQSTGKKLKLKIGNTLIKESKTVKTNQKRKKHTKLSSKKSAKGVLSPRRVYMCGTKLSKFKPHYTTDEFDAKMSSTRGMGNTPPAHITEAELDLITESLVKDYIKKGISLLSIATALNLPIEKVEAIAQNINNSDNNTPTYTPTPITQTENVGNVIDIVARTIYAEARGEPEAGRIGVASVIFNRAGGNPNRLIQVVKKPFAFSPWNDGTPPRGSGKIWDECVKLAEDMVKGNFKPMFGYTHFLNPELTIKIRERSGKNKGLPLWARDNPDTPYTVKKESVRIGRHVFLFG